MSNLQSSYDRLAHEYASRLYGELQHKPFDRKMLDWMVERAGQIGPICDIGCGPGQVARYIHDRGAAVRGIDLSAEMVRKARELNPGVTFEQGDMTSLSGIGDSALGGITAFYSIIHVPHDQLPRALAEFHRVLRPGGVLLVTYHVGDEVRHFDELWGQAVSLDFIFYKTDDIKRLLADAGFDLLEAIERDPYPDVEVATRRAYLFACKPT